MIIKIMTSVEYIQAKHGYSHTHYFEADQFSFTPLLDKEAICSSDGADNVYHLFAETLNGESEEYTAELWFVKDNRRVQILLRTADIFVMNDQGQTVDRLSA